MSRDDITPVVLTWNEAPNVERSLARLTWAKRVVVVDSGSTDGTQEIVGRFSNTKIVERRFDSHSTQWEFAVRCSAVETDWVLALDADYVLSDELVAELSEIDLTTSGFAGFQARIRYCIHGEPLRASLYPPVVALFDRRRGRYIQQGHTQRLKLDGSAGALKGPILHDDRKSMARFVQSQRRYAKLEAEHVRGSEFRELPWSGRIRKLRVLAPILAPIGLLFGKALVLDGRKGLMYVHQRMLAELLISRALVVGDRSESPRKD